MSTIITEAHQSVFEEEKFTKVPNLLIDNDNLCSRSKMLLIYLIRQKPGFIFHDSKMRSFLNCGRDLLEKSFRTLREEGYCKLEFIQDESGSIRGSKRIFARDPIFKNCMAVKVSKASNVDNFTGSLKSSDSAKTHELRRGPESQGPGNQGITNISNNRDNLLSNIRDQYKIPCATPISVPAVVGIKNASPVASVETDIVKASELSAIKKRLNAIKKCNELHTHYQRMSLDDILEEIVFHVENRDRSKCTYARSLNFAILALKKGTWGTPKGLIKKREDGHYSAKKSQMISDAETFRGLSGLMGVSYASF